VQILLNRQLRKDPPVLRDIANPRSGTLFGGWLSKSRGGAPASCQMMVPLSTGTFPAMQFIRVVFPSPAGQRRLYTSLAENLNPHSIAYVGFRKTDSLHADSTSFSP
jgi:hypothetical protein